MNTNSIKRSIAHLIIITLTLLLVIIPASRIQAGSVMDGINTGLDVAGQSTVPGNIMDAGWLYTASASYTLGRIEGKFAEANTTAITLEIYDDLPTSGGNLLASGSFTPTAAAPAGTVWEGADLNTTVSITVGNTYFVSLKDFYSSPTSDAASTTLQLYWSTTPSSYDLLGDATQNATYQPILRFLSADAPSISSGAPGNGTQGTSYSHTYTATGSATITYAVTTGNLPTGLTLSTAGVISGTPTASGLFTGTVTASNGASPDATQNFSITIAAASVAPSITSAVPANGTIGTAYSHTFTATGNPAPTFSVTGTLPTGLTFDGVNKISGTPSAIGTFNGLTVTATNGVLPDATQNFSITIAGIAPSITSAVPANGTLGLAYSHTFTATGNPAATFSVTGTLPTGLTFDGVNKISGTPSAIGTFNGLTVTATNGVSPDATQNFSITIAGIAPSITSAVPANGTLGLAYSHTFTATGNPAATFSVTGTLPTGLTFDGVNTISGTPSATGTFNGLTVTATNGVSPDATQNFSITINGAAPSITSAVPANGTLGLAYSHTFTATGNPAATFSVTGTLPTGLTFDGVNTISGTPSATGTFNGLTVTATNGVSPDATQNFSITINGAAPSITSAVPANGTLGLAYSHTFTATGNPAATFSVTGTLPTGLTFDGVNTISGTPSATGTFNGLTVTATNGVSPDATQNFSITIVGIAPSITSAVPANGTLGLAYSHTFTANGNPAPTFSVSGTLPTGLTFDGVNTISGTPTATGTFNGLTVTATNGVSPDATQNFSITINAAGTVTVSPTTLLNGTVGTAYSQTVSASGGTSPYSFNVTVGALPTGLTLSTGGALSGTPSAAGTFNFTITATDSLSAAGSQAYTVVISASGTPPPLLRSRQ